VRGREESARTLLRPVFDEFAEGAWIRQT
jgi:hypothetical protein